MSLLALLLVLLVADPAVAFDTVVEDASVQSRGVFGFENHGPDDPGVENAADGGSLLSGDLGSAHPLDRSLATLATETIQLNAAIVPEPQPALLTGLGLVGLAVYGRRRRASTRKRG